MDMVNIWRAGCFGELRYGVCVDKAIARHIPIASGFCFLSAYLLRR